MKALGLNLPIQKGQQGYFEQTFDSFTNEKVKLINLFKTIEGERYMQPSFGLSLEKYLFEQITGDLSVKVDNEIRKKVKFWLPNIILNSLNIDIKSGVDRNTITVSTNFSISSNPDNYEVLTFLF
jgi:phage baseplate assembly protein W